VTTLARGFDRDRILALADRDARELPRTRTAVCSDARARFVAAARSGISPVSVVPPAMIPSAFVVRPNRRSALAV
jgi:hypothetical protein